MQAFPWEKRVVIYFETFMTHWTASALGMAVATFIKFGDSGFTIGGVFFFLGSLGLQRLAVLVAKPLTPDDRAQVTFAERLAFAFAGLLIPPLSMMAVVLSQG